MKTIYCVVGLDKETGDCVAVHCFESKRMARKFHSDNIGLGTPEEEFLFRENVLIQQELYCAYCNGEHRGIDCPERM